jgi:hypothetical protein
MNAQTEPILKLTTRDRIMLAELDAAFRSESSGETYRRLSDTHEFLRAQYADSLAEIAKLKCRVRWLSVAAGILIVVALTLAVLYGR